MKKVLLADDMEIFRRQFKRLDCIRNSDYFQITAETDNGKEALDLLRQESFDLVITDIRMPVMDGIELLRKIREENLCDFVVLLSEYKDFSYAKEGIVLGAFDYWEKPVENEKIQLGLERLKKAMREKPEQSETVSASEFNTLCREIFVSGTRLHEILLGIDTKIRERIKRENEESSDYLYQDTLGKLKEKLQQQQPILNQYINFEGYEKRLHENKSIIETVEALSAELYTMNLAVENKLVREICQDILQNIQEEMSLDVFADRYHISKTYLSYLFKKETGTSYIKYLTDMKMKRAKILMLDSNVKIYEVGLFLGYSDTEYFSRLFKKYTGETPTEYKNSLI